MISIVSVARAQFSTGGKIGMNISKIRGADKPDEMEMLPGVNAGVVGIYSFTEKFALQSEINYETKGTGLKDQTSTSDEWISEITNYKEPVGYLTIPVLAKASFGAKTKFYVNAGPYFGFLLSARAKSDVKQTFPLNPENNTDRSYDDDVSEFYAGFDFGVVAGGGAIFTINKNIGIIADLRYNLGLAILDKNGGDKVYNSAFSLSTGVVYKFSEKE